MVVIALGVRYIVIEPQCLVKALFFVPGEVAGQFIGIGYLAGFNAHLQHSSLVASRRDPVLSYPTTLNLNVRPVTQYCSDAGLQCRGLHVG